ncbi:unnamed protein product [Discula destructiva]
MDYTAAGAGAPPGDRGYTTVSHSSASPSGMVQHGSASPPPVKRRRTRAEGPSGNGCLHCRARKVKCPGKPEAGGACKACLKFNFDCNFAKGDEGPGKVVRVPPSIHRTEAGTPRARAPRACDACHTHKTRCTSEHPQCRRCKSMNIECVYQKSKRKSASASASASAAPGSRLASTPRPVEPAPSNLVVSSAEQQQQQPVEVQQSIETNQPASPSVSVSSLTEPNRGLPSGHSLLVEDILARKNVVIKHFQMWFKLWARFPLMDFLHTESTYIEIEENRLNQNLGKIICAITTRYLNPGSKQLPAFADMCAKDVDRYISQHLGAFLKGSGRENLILLVITICYFWMELEMGKVWMLMGLAGRMITALQLNWDGAGETPFEQESIRRAVWEVWKLDRRLAGGFEEHLILRDEVMHLSRPVHDEQIAGHDTTTVGSEQMPPFDPPLCVFHIDLHRMKHHILSVTKNLAISPTPHPRPRVELSQVLEAVNHLQIQLFQFHQSLPECLKVLDHSFGRWATSPDCGSFVMMYTMYCELHIDLYRFSIPGLREEADPEIARQLPRDFVEKSQIQAVGYAVTLSRFWRSMQEQVSKRPAKDGTEKFLTPDTTLIISLIQCTKVLLAARKHRLYTHLEEGSSAPLVRQEPVTDESLAALIQSNMGHFDAFSYFFPRAIEVYTRDLRAAVQNFQGGIPYDNPRQTIGMPARKPPQNVRLPGPHYMLEQAIAPPDEGTKAMNRNKPGADVFYRLKNQNQNQNQPSQREPVRSGGMPTQDEGSSVEKPDIPVWLATARGREADPTVPSEPAVPQQFSAVPFTPFQHQPATPAIPLHSSSVPPYPHQPATPTVPLQSPSAPPPYPSPSMPPCPHQHQYGGQYQPTIPAVPEPVLRTSSSPYVQQQQPGQQQHNSYSSSNTRQQLFTNSTRSSWRRSSSIQSPSSTLTNFPQPPLPVEPFPQYPQQTSVQPLQGPTPPSMPAYFQEQPPLAPSSSYENSSPGRSALEQRLPPDAPDSNSSNNNNNNNDGGSNLPYWPNQTPTAFAMPDAPTARPPSIPLAYDRARGGAPEAAAALLPDPRTLAGQLSTGYYVRAAGTLQRYPAGLIHH